MMKLLVLVVVLLALGQVQAATTLTVVDAWSRPAFDNGVVYATLANYASQPDALIGAKSRIAKHVEIHEGTSSMSPMGSSIASMQRVSRVPVPANERIFLSPGKYHIMLIGLTQ